MKDNEQEQVDPGEMTKDDFVKEFSRLINAKATSLGGAAHSVVTSTGLGTGILWAKGPEKDEDDGTVANRTVLLLLSSSMTIEELRIIEDAYDKVAAAISARTEEIKLRDKRLPSGE
jgi:hypothetical protein